MVARDVTALRHHEDCLVDVRVELLAERLKLLYFEACECPVHDADGHLLALDDALILLLELLDVFKLEGLLQVDVLHAKVESVPDVE